MNRHCLTSVLFPGLLLQSAVIGGGYATGREIVEFFLSLGPVNGLIGMLVATVLFSLIAMLCFEFARIGKSYNYRDFFIRLIGPGWRIYELAYFILAILVLSVLGAAAGEMVRQYLDAPAILGTALLMLAITYLVFRGSLLIERVLASWSLVLYLTFGLFLLIFLMSFGEEVPPALATSTPSLNAVSSGLVYVGYNIVALPAILFCARRMEGRREAILAGLMAGPLTMLPALFLYLAMLAVYPEVLGESVPTDFMMRKLNCEWLTAIFLVVIFGTFIETGSAYIHAINERFASSYRESGRGLPRWLRPAVALLLLVLAMVLADQFGVVRLIAEGYAALTWVFIAIFIVPLFSLGLWRILRYSASVQRSSLDMS